MASAADQLKKIIIALENEEELAAEARNRAPREVIVVADSVKQALKLAAAEMQKDPLQLDYKILNKGGSQLLGLRRLPYRVHVFQAKEDTRFSDLEDMNVSLTGAMAQAALMDEGGPIAINAEGKILVRIYRTGVYIVVRPPVGEGQPVTMQQALEKLRQAGVTAYDKGRLESEIRTKSGKQIKIAEWTPRPDADSQLQIEVTADRMRATMVMTRPRPGGRHLQVADVMQALKANGVQFGFRENIIEKALEEEVYSTPVVVAEGKAAQHGRDGYIDYKIRIDKKVEFKEDESGRVDFLQRDLVENVVQGQVLAELVPAQRGQEGRDLFNKITPAKNGNPVTIRPGPGTMLSDDGKRLLAAPRVGRDALVAHERRVLAKTQSVRSECVGPVFVSGDCVVIRWRFRFESHDGRVRELEELAYQQWQGDRIHREQFFYDPAQFAPRPVGAGAG